MSDDYSINMPLNNHKNFYKLYLKKTMKEAFSVSFILRLGFSQTFDMIKTINFDDKIVLVSRHYTIFHNTAGENNIGVPKIHKSFGTLSNCSIIQYSNSNIGLFLQ